MSETSSHDPVARFRAALSGQLGLAFEDQRLPQLAEVFEERVAAHGGDVEAYLHGLERGATSDELASIARRVTVPETYFFRHSQQFEALRALLIRHFRPSAPPRLLSAGCASGEEAYSLVMALRELWPDREASVVAVDVNPAILERARAGRYSSWSLRETPPPSLSRWFRQEGREFVLDDAIRRSVRFVPANLASDEPRELYAPGSFDIIFCRNVLMYFTPGQFRAAVRRLSRALVAEGHLFLGSAETLRGMSHDFHLRHTHEAFYYQRKSQRELSQPAPPLPSERQWPLPPPEVEAGAWVEEIGRAAARIAALTAEPLAAGPLAGGRLAPVPPRATPTAGRAHPRARLDLSSALDLLHKEHFSEALDQVRALSAEAGSDPDAMLLEAVLLASAARFDESDRMCQHLLAIDELNAGAHYVLALCSAGGQRIDQAVHHDRVATYLDPGFAMPRLHLGLMLRREGQRASAREELARARSLLEREDGARLLLFGGGFSRGALLALCDAELELTASASARTATRASRGMG
jgi:chemotaxis protein methyltransferase CheR